MSTCSHFDGEITENIVLASQVSSCIVLAGRRQFDRFLIAGSNGIPRTVSLERLCHESINANDTWIYDPARRCVQLARSGQSAHMKSPLPSKVGKEVTLSPIEVVQAFSELSAVDDKARFALLIDASLLIEEPSTPRDDDFHLLQAIERFARTTSRDHVLLLRVGRTTELPNAILTSPQVRTVHIPAASRDVRYSYAITRGQALADRCSVEGDAVARTLSDATDDWTLDQLDALIRTVEHQPGIESLHDLEEVARAVRIGTTHSPWAGDRIHNAVANSCEELTKRVLGQPKAVNSVVLALRKAVTGLAGAHQSQGVQTPRAVFFFAGPTGTGKTELAKAISQLVFGQEQLLRFDCGELRQEHAVARLIGSPPGFVGYDRGGELTEGIRTKPNSVVLFDEIEKAHPRLLDTLLGVLDDGRLTSGQGETTFFGQSILIFTSNLGMYEEIVDERGVTNRCPRFDYEASFDVIERTVREAIRDEFVGNLGRPELLGRFGGAESIVVFDYLRDLDSVCRKFVSNISATCLRLHGLELEVDNTVIDEIVHATCARPEALVLGGRGMRHELDHWLVDPLADHLFDDLEIKGRLCAAIQNGRTVFTQG